MGETGYLYAVICAAVQSIFVITAGLCLERLLKGRDDRISKRGRLTLWGSVGIVTQSMKCLLPVPSIWLSIINSIVIPLFLFFMAHYCYSGPGVSKFIHPGMLLLQNALADVFYQSLWGGQYPVEMIWKSPFKNKAVAETCIMIAAITAILNIFYTAFVLNIRKKKHERTNPVWIAATLLFLLPLAAIRWMRNVRTSGDSPDSYFIFICIFSVAVYAVLMLFLSRSEKKEAQEERQQMMEEVRELQHAMELEKVHYEQIEARREEMAKLRHDYNNVITSVMYLIENGKTEEAREIMRDLSERINGTKE